MKSEKLKFMLFLLFAFFFITGCTVQQNSNLGCCVLDKTNPASPTCKNLQGTTTTGVNLIGTVFCDAVKGFCNVTVSDSNVIYAIGQTPPPKGSATEVSVPICSDRSFSCISNTCYAQVCGPFKYVPKPVPSFSDTVSFRSQLGFIPNSYGTKNPQSLNLYATSCQVIQANETLKNVMENTKGSAVNVFRFGVGNTFEDYENYRYLFPISDSYCNVNTVSSNAKDRFMNYLLSPSEFAIKYSDAPLVDIRGNFISSPRSYTPPWQKVANDNFCPATSTSPFLSTSSIFRAPGSSNIVNYQLTSFGSYSTQFYTPARGETLSLNIDETTMPPANSPTTSGSVIDKKFYANMLALIYEDELNQGLNSVGGNPVPAPFECSSSIECSSGYCNYNDYNRGLCSKNGQWVECSCNSLALGCYGVTTTKSYLQGVGKPNSAQALNSYINAYQAGTPYYSQTKVPFNLKYAGAQPRCTSGIITSAQVAGILTIEDQGSCTIDNSGNIVCAINANYNGNDQKTKNVKGTTITVATNSIRFPRDIEFFGSVKPNNYIGYSLLDEPAFRQTDFFRTCGPLVNGVDYDISNPTKIISSPAGTPREDIDCNSAPCPPTPGRNAFISGTAIRPPEAPNSNWRTDNYLALGDIPILFGAQSIEPASAICDDDTGWNHYIYSNQYIMLKAKQVGATLKVGQCDLDQNTYTPKTISFGWCEACSYATFAKQIVTSTAPKIYNDQSAPNSYINNNPGLSQPVDIYLQDKVGKYLKEGTMPVFDLSDNSNWVTTLIKSTSGDRGPYYSVDFLRDARGEFERGVRGQRNSITFGASSGSLLSPGFGQPGANFDQSISDWLDQFAQNFQDYVRDLIKALKLSRANPQAKDLGPSVLIVGNVSLNDAIGGNQITITYTPKISSIRTADTFYNLDVTIQSTALPAVGSRTLTFTANPDTPGVQFNSQNAGYQRIDPNDPNSGSYNSGDLNAGYGNWANILNDFSATETKTMSLNGLNYNIVVDKVASLFSCVVGGGPGPSKWYTNSFRVTTKITNSNGQVFPQIIKNVNIFQPGDPPYWVGNIMYGGPSGPKGCPLVPPTFTDPANVDRRGTPPFKDRIDIAKADCPNCLIGFRIYNLVDAQGVPITSGSVRRVTDIQTLNNIINFDKSVVNIGQVPNKYTIIPNVDVITYAFYPDEYTSQDNSVCVNGNAQNEFIVSELENLSKTTLYNSGKVSLISDFSINPADNSCWSNTQQQNFFSYLFIRERRLSGAGLMGVIYSNTNSLKTQSGSTYDNSAQFCDLYQGSKQLVADPPLTVYSKVYTSPTVTCVQCDDIDISLGKCDPTQTNAQGVPASELCANNIACTLPPGATRQADGPFKCPEDTIPEPCTPCSQSPDSLDCTTFKSDGTKDTNTFDVNTLSDTTADIIASIPRPSTGVCCLLESNPQARSGQSSTRTYTYIKKTNLGRNAGPMVFSFSGIAGDDCGVPDISSAAPSMCSVANAPIKNYRVQCTLIPGAVAGVAPGVGGSPPPAPQPGGGGGIISPGAGGSGSGGAGGSNAGGSGGN